MGKKLSYQYWQKNKGTNLIGHPVLNETFKPTYDKILSLEAKIEEVGYLSKLTENLKGKSFLIRRQITFESELQQIKEQEKL